MYLDSYDRVERRIEIEKLLKEVDQLAEKALDYLVSNNLQAADDCHSKMKHLLEQASSGVDQLKADIEE